MVVQSCVLFEISFVLHLFCCSFLCRSSSFLLFRFGTSNLYLNPTVLNFQNGVRRSDRGPTPLSGFSVLFKYQTRHPYGFEGFPSLRNKTKQLTNHQRKHPYYAREPSAEELSTMSKNKLRGITLAVKSIWEVHSLTLIFSC